MRGLALFVVGALVGVAATSMAQNQGPNRGVVGINHVALAVPDIDKAVEHYTKVMGFPEAFRVRTPQGEVQLVYIQVSKDTFIELQTINAQRPAGIYHFGVVVEDMAQATAMWKARGADVREITPSSSTKAILSNIYDPKRAVELLHPAGSLHAQATARSVPKADQPAVCQRPRAAARTQVERVRRRGKRLPPAPYCRPRAVVRPASAALLGCGRQTKGPERTACWSARRKSASASGSFVSFRPKCAAALA